MPNITLTVPTIVQTALIDDHLHYHLRPLFFNHPVATHRRYDRAVAIFKRELKHYFRGYVLNRENSHHLFWYLFNPKVTYTTFPLSLIVKKQNISGRFGAASFQVQEKTFVALPAFHNFVFLAEGKLKGKGALQSQAENVIKNLLKLYKEEDGSDFDEERYFSDKRTFVSTIEQTVNVGFDKYKFEQVEYQWFFSAVGGTQEFDGSMELEKTGIDLNAKYPEELQRAYYQDDLVSQLYQIIYKKENTPIVLIGGEGYGKHTVIEEVVFRYLSDFYGKIKGRKQHLWHLNPNRVISGMSIVGMWEKRFESILKFVMKPLTKASNSDILLVDNPVALFRIGKSASNSLTLGNVLKPYLEKRQLQLVLLASPEEWKVVQEQDRGFSDLFQIIRLKEPNREKAVKIALHLRKQLEVENDCRINIQAINQMFAIHRNYLKNKALPGAVVKMMSQLATKYRYKTIDATEVREEFQFYSGLKEKIFDESSVFEKGEVKKMMESELVGQPKVIDSLVEVVHSIKSKLNDKTKPIASFMFIGPTGVGKTQAAKVLCKYLMGSEKPLMRFDMNEYIDIGGLERLIGDYYNPEGQLTGKVRYQPFGVLLFDEIEKAHPKIHDLLLQVLDDGRLTDSLGRTVDFSNTIVIMTSNVGAREASTQLGFGTAKRDEGAVYRKAVEKKFRPEFINRIDRIVIFNPLAIEHILGIARLQIKELLKRDGFVRRTTILNISQEALEWVAKRGYDERMGGRALKRQIERDLTTLSAQQLISTYSESPIFFDILLEDNRLVPKITPLRFVDPLENNWIPELPDETKGKSFYSRLLNELESLERKIVQLEDYEEEEESGMIVIGNDQGENLNWQHYDFKNKVAEAKEKLNTIRLGFRDRYFREGPAIPLRLKGGNLVGSNDLSVKGIRENYKDRLFQEEALKEIRETYQYAPAQFDSLKTEFIKNFLDVAFLKVFSKGFLKGNSEKISIQFKSFITSQGEEQIQFLIELYCSLLEKLEIQYEVLKDQQIINSEGYSLYELLGGEEGLHLFYLAHQNPLPIQLKLIQNNRELDPVFEVIRIYDGTNTLTDLRTGFSNDVNITPEEFKLLLFAGIQSKTLA